MNHEYYLFDDNDSATEHLALVNHIYNPYSRRFISEALLPQGNVLEVACGSGFMSQWLAEQPNVTSVLGIDVNTTAIETATRICNEANLKNTTFKVLSVYDLDLIEETFDIIYLRFLLIHLTNPMAALRAIHNKLKPTGTMICETAIHSHCFSDPKVNSYDQFIKLIMQFLSSQGKECDLGKQIYSLCRTQKFSITKMNFIQPLLQTLQEKKAMFLGLQMTRDLFIQNKLATEKELDDLLLQMEKDYLYTDSIWGAPTLCQIAAIQTPI